jgi:hypothetical protein
MVTAYEEIPLVTSGASSDVLTSAPQRDGLDRRRQTVQEAIRLALSHFIYEARPYVRLVTRNLSSLEQLIKTEFMRSSRLQRERIVFGTCMLLGFIVTLGCLRFNQTLMEQRRGL